MFSLLNPPCSLMSLFISEWMPFTGSSGFSLSLIPFVSDVGWVSLVRRSAFISDECELSPSWTRTDPGSMHLAKAVSVLFFDGFETFSQKAAVFLPSVATPTHILFLDIPLSLLPSFVASLDLTTEKNVSSRNTLSLRTVPLWDPRRTRKTFPSQ